MIETLRIFSLSEVFNVDRRTSTSDAKTLFWEGDFSSCVHEAMFIVKYGSDQQKIFNSNCQGINLLQHIATACGCKGEIDLAEESTGLLQFLRDFPYVYANTSLKPRGSYVLVQVNRVDDHNITYVPLWEASVKSTGQPVKFVVKAQKQLVMRGKAKMEEPPFVPSGKPVIPETKTNQSQPRTNKKQPVSKEKPSNAENTPTVTPAQTTSPVTKPPVNPQPASNSNNNNNNSNPTPTTSATNTSTKPTPATTQAAQATSTNQTNQSANPSPSKDPTPVKKKVVTKAVAQ